MKKVFTYNNNAGQSTVIGIALSDEKEYKKIILRYYSITDDFNIKEIEFCCKETLKIEKDCRKWCEKENLILWSC